MDTDCFIALTKEYQVLQKYFSDLTRSITSPVTLAAALFSADLISESTRIKATSENSNHEIKTSHYLVGDLMVALNHDKFMKILSVLECHPPLLRDIAEKMKRDYESSTTIITDQKQLQNESAELLMTTTSQSTYQHNVQKPIIVGESAYNDLLVMQGKLGSLVLDVQEIAELADVNIDRLKQLLILSYPFEEEELQNAKDLPHVFIAIRKLCSPVNIEALVLIVDYFKLSDARTAIQQYEADEQNYRKKLLSTSFAKELKKEAELLNRNPTPECTIALKLKWSSTNNFTVKEFERVVKNLFLEYSQYIHIYNVGTGCIFVTMCAPKVLMGALAKMAKTRLLYLHNTGVILLQIGDEVILDKREKMNDNSQRSAENILTSEPEAAPSSIIMDDPSYKHEQEGLIKEKQLLLSLLSQVQLDHTHLNDVLNALKSALFQKRKWYDLGLVLGLLESTLKTIQDQHDSVTQCLQECLSLWLRRVDNVDKKGKPTWDILTRALQEVEEIDVAESISQKVKKEIYSAAQALICPVEMSQLLYSKGCITEMVLDKIESLEASLQDKKANLMTAIHEGILLDHKKLKVLAVVLSKFEETRLIGQDLFSKYAQKFPDDQEATASDKSQTDPSYQISDHCDILRCHYAILSQCLYDPMSVGQSLFDEDSTIISEETLLSLESFDRPESERRVLLLRGVRGAVHTSSHNLEVFISVLLKFTKNVPLATAMLKDYKRVVCDLEEICTSEELTSMKMAFVGTTSHVGQVPNEIHIPQSMSPNFRSIRMEFAIAFYNIHLAITNSLPFITEDLKKLLQDCFPELVPRLTNCKSIDDVLDLVQDKCSLININCLEIIVKRFYIKDAEVYIQAYNEIIKAFIQSVTVCLCLNENFEVTNALSPLQCETAKFVLDWKLEDLDKFTLSDVLEILSISLESRLSKRVKVIAVTFDNFITVTCTFSLSLATSLIAKAQKTIEAVKKKGLVVLSIGQCTVCDFNRKVEEVRSLEIKDELDKLRKKLETQYNIIKKQTLEIEKLKHTMTLKQKDTEQKEQELKMLLKEKEETLKLSLKKESILGEKKDVIDEKSEETSISREKTEMTASLNPRPNTQGRGGTLRYSIGGIQKLPQYITTNFRDWEDKSLAGCPLVLDGNSLPYYLSKRAELEWKYGGQYPALRKIMESFFETLLAENIKPIHIVFDGIGPEEKLETVLNRRQGFLDTIKKCFNGEVVPPNVEKNILPPLVTEVFRKVVQDYKHQGVVKIYSADGEADGIAVTLSNTFNCPLIGEDSDFFIAPLQAGYVPLSNLEWTRPGAHVTAKIYHREAFAASLGISPDLILAIPAIAGSDIMTNLVEETSLKYQVRDNPRYRGKDTERTINFIRSCKTLERLESSLQRLTDGQNVLAKFHANFQKAQEIYENIQPFNEKKFKVSSSIRRMDGRKLPQWLIEQYREFNFSYRMLEVYVTAQYLFRVIPDDFSQPSTKLFSRPIRQEIYGLIKPEGGNVAEVIRVRDHLAKEDVTPIISGMNIHTINRVSQDERMKKLCQVLLCDPSTLSVINQEWHIAIASVCFWAKTARIMKNNLQLKSLVLCFTQCYTQDMATFKPAFNIATLHLYTQWQCVYHDAILLNQVLALPLPYLSPAVLFDGKCVTSYSQLRERDFDLLLTRGTRESQELYRKIISIVNANM